MIEREKDPAAEHRTGFNDSIPDPDVTPDCPEWVRVRFDTDDGSLAQPQVPGPPNAPGAHHGSAVSHETDKPAHRPGSRNVKA